MQVGTAFIASDESAAIPAYKKALQNAIDTDIVLTKAITGRWARGISNTLIKEIEKSGIDIPAYPIQNSLTAPLRTVCQKNGNAEFISLWAGQSANKAQAKPVAEILKTIIEEAEGE